MSPMSLASLNKYESVTTSDLQTKSNTVEICPKCGEKIEPFYMRIHRCEGTD